MATNPLKAKLAAGEPILGIWSIIPSPMTAEIAGHAGLDFLILDGEHGVFSLPALDDCIRACEGVGCSPLVRAPSVDQFYAQSVLDLGAHGVVFPQITGYEAARKALSFLRYGPEGVRGYNPFARAGAYGAPTRRRPSLQEDDFIFSTAIIESVQAFQELDRILTLPGLDMLYLGVYDMSISMGCRGEVDNPRVVDFVESAVPRIRAAGKAAGVMARNAEEIDRFLELGANALVYGVDSAVIHGAMAAGVAALQAARK